MYTHEDALAHITEAIEATGVVEDAATEYDLDAMAETLYTIAGGTWDLSELDSGKFWWAVERHALGDPDAPVDLEPPTTPSPASDETASALADARDKVAAAREALKAAESERDQLLGRAHRTGAYTKADLARMAGLTRGRVAQILS